MAVNGEASVPALSDMYVYVTDRCNCTCVHCWIIDASRNGGQPGHFICPEILDAAIEEARPLGLTSLKWTGGEPTIHPNFPGLLEIQKKHGLRGRMETNGLRITPELAAQLAESGVNHISVSVDGARPATHDAIRGFRGAQERTLLGVRRLVEAGYRPQLIMSLMRANVDEIDDFLALAAEVGAGSVKFNVVQPTLRGEALHATGGALSVREVIALNRQVEQEFVPKYSYPIYFDIPMAFRPLSRIMERGAGRCGILNILGLLADGHYALCGIGVHEPEMVFGRAGVGELDSIWSNHAVLRKIREGLPDQLMGICGNCLMKGMCLGSCVAQGYYRTHDLLAENWFCQAAVTEGLFPETRAYHRVSVVQTIEQPIVSQ